MKAPSNDLPEEFSGAEFAQIAASLGFGTWYFSPTKGSISLNLVAARLFGLESADVYPVSQILDLTTLSDNENLSQFEQWIYNPITQTEFFLKLKHPSGQIRTLLMRASSLRQSSQTCSEMDMSVGGIVCDVTALKQQLTQEREAQRLDSLSRLAGGISHEFNNMLTVILGSINLALDLTPPQHPNTDNLLAIRTAAERCVLLTEQLLTFARRQSSHLRHFDLNHAVRQAIPSLQEFLPSHILLEYELQDELPVFIDLSHLYLIIMQAAANARDAMPAKGIFRISTQLITHKHKKLARLEMTDTGLGMASDVLHRALDPFFSTKSPREGSGLGLSMIYGIARKHQAALSIDSKPNSGTTLRLDFPIATLPRRRGHVGITSGTLPASVLLLARDPRERAVTAKVLEQLGHEVLEARDDVEALALASASQVRLLVCENPPADQIEHLISTLRLHHLDLPVLLLESQPLSLSAFPHLHRLSYPCPPASLLEVAQKALTKADSSLV